MYKDMKISGKKITMVILAASIIFLNITLTACKKSSDKPSAIPADITTGPVEEDEEERLYPGLEPKDFDYEFTILEVETPGFNKDIFAESIEGEPVNDAVYARNNKIKAKYNITIKRILDKRPEMLNRVHHAYFTGDDIYDAIIAKVDYEVRTMSLDGSLGNLYIVPNLDLTRPWWNQVTERDLSMGNKLFVVQGDLLTTDKDSAHVILFDKTLMEKSGMGIDPYEMVKRGEWTFGKLLEMTKSVSQDLNGDGKMNASDDLFGLALQDDTAFSFLVSGGEKICDKDRNDYPIITFGSERCYKIMEMVSELMLDTHHVTNYHREQFDKINMIQSHRCLFMATRLFLVSSLRGVDTDFGILPVPKLDKAQENYITSMNVYLATGVCVPSVASDLERTGMILEDLCAESRYTLQPAYYDINLYGKFIRDEESREMLEIILSNPTIDIGNAYDFGQFSSTILTFGRSQQTTYASTFEKLEDKMKKDIDDMIAAYEKLS